MASPCQRNNTRLLICYKLEMLTVKAGVLFIARTQGNTYNTKNSNMTLQQCSHLEQNDHNSEEQSALKFIKLLRQLSHHSLPLSL